MTSAAAMPASDSQSSQFRYRDNPKVDQWICFWSIPVFYLLFGIVFVLFGRIMPPPTPTMSTTDIVAFMTAPGLPFAVTLLALTLGLYALNSGLMLYQMKRMEGVSPVLRYAYIAVLGVGGVPGCLFPGYMFALGAFRPEYEPHILVMLYDLGFLCFVGSLGCFIIQYVVFSIAVFLDRKGIFPKWLGYFSIWTLVTEIVAAPVFITQSGPFAWDGLLAFYQGTIIWVGWQTCVTVYLYKAIKSQPLAELDLPAAESRLDSRN
ncbi:MULTISPECIES: hypothetical protein [unclassified Ketobacter]|uniref:hypothetical protein n=1 Tax=unclassified Ketobacter TaxID=2639109 RepID=UPI0025C31461|nr:MULTISPECIES: hypothetical protein [unclassified Ketobacter]